MGLLEDTVFSTVEATTADRILSPNAALANMSKDYWRIAARNRGVVSQSVAGSRNLRPLTIPPLDVKFI